jgi:hypothetical protein
MKTNIVTFFILMVLGFAVLPTYAQQESSLGGFIATPVGDFKSTDLDDGGFAKKGWGVVFDSKSKFKGLPEGLTIYFHSTYQWNEMDTETLAKEFTESLGMRTEITNSKYSPILATIGPAYDFKLAENFKLGINGTVGIMFNNTKAFSIKVYDDNNNLIVNEHYNFDNNVAFAYSFGAELRYDIVPKVLGFALYTDYTSAKQSTDISSQNTDVETFQKLQYLNLGAKLVFLAK